MSDLDRFMQSPEGQARLEEIRQSLIGRTIKAGEFSSNIHTIDMELVLDGEKLRDQFQEMLEREYYIDYPER